jgi:hypothetical protein
MGVDRPWGLDYNPPADDVERFVSLPLFGDL